MLVTLANPLPFAIVGNPGKGRSMRKRSSKSHSRKLANRRQLRYRWKQRTKRGGKFFGFKATVLDRAGRRKRHSKPRGHRWAWTGRKGTVQLTRKGHLVATNPVASAKALFISPITALPKSLPALFKGKGMIKHVGFAAGGAVTGLVGGSIVQAQVLNIASRFLPAAVTGALANPIVQRIVGASFALLTGGLVAKYALKGENKSAFITGVAAAALAEALFPGRVASLMTNIPVVGPMLAPAASPVNGLAGLFGYVEARGYQGVGTYVDASAYQGVGEVGAYVDASAYQGVGSDDAIAGLGYDPNQLAGGVGHLGDVGAMGSNMASHLDS